MLLITDFEHGSINSRSTLQEHRRPELFKPEMGGGGTEELALTYSLIDKGGKEENARFSLDLLYRMGMSFIIIIQNGYVLFH